MYLWELEDSLLWELLASTCTVPLGSIKLSITTGSIRPRPCGCLLSWMIVAHSALPCTREMNCLGVHGGICSKSYLVELLYDSVRSQGTLFLC